MKKEEKWFLSYFCEKDRERLRKEERIAEEG